MNAAEARMNREILWKIAEKKRNSSIIKHDS